MQGHDGGQLESARHWVAMEGERRLLCGSCDGGAWHVFVARRGTVTPAPEENVWVAPAHVWMVLYLSAEPNSYST